MPRLPDMEALGNRPVADSRRAIASNPAAGAVGNAVEGLGQAVTQIGDHQLAAQDQLSVAAAKSAYQQADVRARTALQDDPDYGTFTQRYTEQMKAAQAAAGGMIRNKQERALFQSTIGDDFQRGLSQVQIVAHAKGVVAGKAVLSQTLENARNAGRDAPDEGTRAATLNTANEAIAAAQKGGLLDPLEATATRQSFASDYIAQQTTMALDREDPTAAAGILSRSGDMLDWRTRLQLEARVKEVTDHRTAIGDAEAQLGVATPTGGVSSAIADPLGGKGRGPVPGGQFGASRDYGAHKGVDWPAPVGTAVMSTAPGTVSVSRSKLGGNIVTVTQANGDYWKFDHLGAVSVHDGDVVTPGASIGTVGMTGRSTGPHLHVELWRDGKPVDPTHVIGQTTGGGAGGAPRIDLARVNSNLEAQAAAEGWSPERLDRAKAQVTARVGFDDRIRQRQAEDAKDDASRWLLAQPPGGFTDITQMPANLRSTLQATSPETLLQYRSAAEANKKALLSPAAPNSATVVNLHSLMYENPTAFQQRNLELDRGHMTPGEYDELHTAQAKMRADPQEVAKYSQVFDTIRTFGDTVIGAPPKVPTVKPGTAPAPSKDYQAWEQNRMGLANAMQAYLGRLRTYDPNHKLTEDDFRRAYDNATMRVLQPDGSYRYRYQTDRPQAHAIGMSQADTDRISARLRAHGIAPTPENIRRAYMNAAVGGGQ